MGRSGSQGGYTLYTSSGDPSRKKRSSLNAKYDRLFGNTSSIRTGRASLELLAEADLSLRSRALEKQEQERKDYEAMLKRKGVKMGTVGRGSRDLNGGGGVFSNLQKYRMGNVPPPRGKTPPVTLDQSLRDIIFPPKPPPKPPAPPYQPLPPAYHSSLRRLSEPQQSYAHDPRHRAYAIPQQHQRTPLSPCHVPSVQPQGLQTPVSATSCPPIFIPPLPPVGTSQVTGWIYTSNTGWVYIPPPTYFSPAQIPYVQDPPPPFVHSYETTRNSETSSHEVDLYAQSTLHAPPSSDDTDDHLQPTLPKSILRNSSSSEVSHSGPSSRTVTFRDTPDFASPHVLDMMEYRRSNNEQREETEEAARYSPPPKWRLRKTVPTGPAAPGDEAEADYAAPQDSSNGPREDTRVTQALAHGLDRHGYNPGSSAIPSILANAHQQLLHGHGIVPEASGKRSGRALVKSLEDMAEAQSRRSPPAYNSWDNQNATRRRDVLLADSHGDRTYPRLDTRVTQGSSKVGAGSGHRALPNEGSSPSKRKLPPPSQNWREDQRPQMAFSSTGSQSQVSGSQLSAQQSASQQGPLGSESRHTSYCGSQSDKQDRRDRQLTPVDPYPGHENPDTRASPKYQEDQEERIQDQRLQPTLQEDHQDQFQQEEVEHAVQHPKASFLAPSSPVTNSKASTKAPRRRLTDLEVRYDDDPTDSSYRPELSPDVDDIDFDVDLDELLNLGNEPMGKRIKVTEGAWAQYHIPRDKLPQVSQPPHRARGRMLSKSNVNSRNQQIGKRRWEVKNESQSQVSQIEQSEDGEEDRGKGEEDEPGEEIDGSWSYEQSQQSGDGGTGGNGKLATIAEEEEGEEMTGVVGNGPAAACTTEGQKSWVEEGFFGDGEELGFQIWRDRY